MVLVLYRELVHAYPQLRRTASVAVISPYKAQVGAGAGLHGSGGGGKREGREGRGRAWRYAGALRVVARPHWTSAA